MNINIKKKKKGPGARRRGEGLEEENSREENSKLDGEKGEGGGEAQGEEDTLISGNCYHLSTVFHQAFARTSSLWI